MTAALILAALLISHAAIFSFGFVIGLASYPRQAKHLEEPKADPYESWRYR